MIETEYSADGDSSPKVEKRTFGNVDDISLSEYMLYRLDTFMEYLDGVRVEQIPQALFILLSLVTQNTIAPIETMRTEFPSKVAGIIREHLPTFMEVVKGSEFVTLP